MSGANNCKLMVKNQLSLRPIIRYTQLLNRSIPKNQDIAIVWKKHTHKSDSPEAA